MHGQPLKADLVSTSVCYQSIRMKLSFVHRKVAREPNSRNFEMFVPLVHEWIFVHWMQSRTRTLVHAYDYMSTMSSHSLQILPRLLRTLVPNRDVQA